MIRGNWTYRDDIDGLRAVAIALVLIFHGASDRLPGGYLGVDVFFVISGFLITGIIKSANERGQFSFASFYAARVRRLFPALLVVMAATLVGGYFLLVSDEYASLGEQTAASTLFAANFYFWFTTDYFRHSELYPLLHLWSLGVEEQYYFAWPLVLLAGLKVRKGAVAIALAILAPSLTYNLYLATADPIAGFYNPAARAWELMAGSLLALSGWRLGRGPIGQAAALFALAALGAAAFVPATLAIGGLATVIPVAATVLLIAAPDSMVNRHLLSLRPAIYAGKISYPLYLWHWPILTFLAAWHFGIAPPSWRIAGLAAAVVLAALTYRYVEVPRVKKYVAGLVAGAGLIGLAGLWLSMTGLPDRPVNREPKAAFVAKFRADRLDKAQLGAGIACDFYDFDGHFAKERVDPSCSAPTTAPSLILWGDSHAAALAPGIATLFPGPQMLTLSTSACVPSVGAQVGGSDALSRACRRSNDHAKAVIERVKPRYLVLAQMFEGGPGEYWAEIARWARAHGVAKVVAIGPPPKFYPSLPASVARAHWDDPNPFMSAGLSGDVLRLDAQLKAIHRLDPSIDYVSLIDALCRGQACRGRLPHGKRDDLLFLDYGHLTRDGSTYVAETILAPHLGKPRRRPGEEASPI